MDQRTGLTMTILRLSLLGEPCLTIPDGQALTTPGPKAMALLACLATAPDLRISRATLVDLLWSDASSTFAARHALRQCLVRLRAQLGDASGALMADAEVVWLNADLVALDVTELRAALLDGTRHSILSLAIRGRFCAGLDVRVAGFEAWLSDQRREYDQLCAELCGKAALILAGAGEELPAIAAARRRLDFEPFQDDAHAALIALCVGFGRRQEAALAHAACHDLFRSELSIEPAPQVDAALRVKVPARRLPLPLQLQTAPIAPRRPVFGAFAAGLAAAATLFHLLGPWPDGQTTEPSRNQMSIWVSPASAGAVQGKATGTSLTKAALTASDDARGKIIGGIPDEETDYAMLYPAGC